MKQRLDNDHENRPLKKFSTWNSFSTVWSAAFSVGLVDAIGMFA